MTKLIIFDLDGVLIDSFEAWWKATKEVLPGEVMVSKKAFRDRWWGRPLNTSLKKVMDNRNVDDIAEKQRGCFLKHVSKVKLFPRVIEVLEYLKNKYKLALLSNNKKYVLDKILRHFDLDCFDMVVGRAKGAKPSPVGINKICDGLKVDKKDVVFVGDTVVDKETGNNAGVKTLIVGKDMDGVRDLVELF